MHAIHLIQKAEAGVPKPTPIERGSSTYRSGNWVVSAETAAALIGKKIYFHRKQASPSFFGGVITEFVKREDLGGRVIFTFEAQDDCKNVKAGAEGWSQEIKIQK